MADNDNKAEDEARMPAEAGDIGDEQNPAYIEKTDKADWTQAADKAKKEPSLLDKIQGLEEGET